MKPSRFFVPLLVGVSLLAGSCGSPTEGAPTKSSQAQPRGEATATAPTTGMTREETTATAPEKTAADAAKERPAGEKPKPKEETSEKIVEVRIGGLQYLPGPVTVSPGTTVRWVNEDRALHTVTSEGPLQSEELEGGDSYGYTFREPGRYDYYCAVHPFMKSGVTVE